MLIVTTVPAAIGLMLVGILLLGAWPVVWHAVEGRGRLPAHIFLDYALTYVFIATAVALTLGQLEPPADAAAAAAAAAPRFTDQLRDISSNAKMVAFALAGGVCLALGDLAMQYATALMGLSIGPALLNALTVIIGIVLAYFLDGGINKPTLVFPGMACAAGAIALGAVAHVLRQRQQQQQQQKQQQEQAGGGGSKDVAAPNAPASASQLMCRHEDQDVELQRPDQCHHQQHQHQQQQQQQRGSIRQVTADSRASSGTTGSCQQTTEAARNKLQRNRSIQMRPGTSSLVGLSIAVAGGVVYGLFLPAFQIAANDPFALLDPATPPLTVYTTYFFFGVGFAASSAALNTWFLYRPPLGVARSSLTCYLRDNGSGRLLSVLSGVLAALGDLTQFIGGQVAGYAACFLVMAYPLVSALFGLFRYRELQQASRWGVMCVVGQVVCYAASVALLAASAEMRVGHSSSSTT